MNDYTQNVKNIARSELIQNAIKILTSERHNSTIATRNYVREVKSCLLNRDHSKDVEYAQKLSDDSIEKWEYMYDSIIEKKSANQLKIAYLCGPQPENDLEEFLKQGILPENIWAFENGNNEFSCAIKNICAVNYPFVKVINANIADFCSQSSIRFDFIYLDFCGSIASKESKTVKTLAKIIQSHSLNNFGILATNFSLQTYEQDEKNSENLDRLMSTYLYPKTFLGNIENDSYNTIEGPTSHYTDIDEWIAIVQKYRDFYYGEFVSLFLIDLFQIITPYGYFLKNKTLFDTLFKIQNKDKFIEKLNIFLGKSEYKCGCECKCECQSEYEEYEECKHNYDCECRYDCECECGCKLPEIMTEPYANSILWALVVLSDKKIMESFGINTKGFDKYCESFISQISGNIDDSKKYLENIFSILFLLQEENSINNYYGEKLNSLKGVHNFNNFYQFCDLFLFHQIKELLVRQLSVPYHINIEKSERWQYRAKKTDMFMDMFVLDECRYLYDWMPSIGTIDKCLDDLERQFVFRFVLDAISKHRQYYCTELFFGTAVTSADEKGFGLKKLKQRKLIKEQSQMQTPILATYMRGGTSKGTFFNLADLPKPCQVAGQARDTFLLRVVGSPDPYGKQIDGLGNGSSSTSKVAIISPCTDGTHDVNYLFGQVAIDKAMIDWSGNCGNLTGAVGSFAIFNGLIDKEKIPENGICTVKIYQQNIGKTIIAYVPIKDGQVVETGDFELDGVTFPASEIKIEFIDPVDDTGEMFPTGNLTDTLAVPFVGDFTVTMINAGIPTIFLYAHELGLSGTEKQADINANGEILAKLEKIRAYGAVKMGLIDDVSEAVSRQHTPKIAWVAPPCDYVASSGKTVKADDIDLLVRAMSMGQLHHAMMGTASVAIGTAGTIVGTIVNEVASGKDLSEVCFGHPSGTLTVGGQSECVNGKWVARKVSMSRSARRLMTGQVWVPSDCF